MTKYRKERLPTHPCRGKKDFQGSMARLAEICRRSVKLFLVSRPPSSCLYTRFTSSTSQSWKIHGFTLLKNSQWLGNISFSFFILLLEPFSSFVICFYALRFRIWKYGHCCWDVLYHISMFCRWPQFWITKTTIFFSGLSRIKQRNVCFLLLFQESCLYLGRVIGCSTEARRGHGFAIIICFFCTVQLEARTHYFIQYLIAHNIQDYISQICQILWHFYLLSKQWVFP